ncbi:porin family protein [Aliidiomarina sp. Khilg15.8]
MKALPLLSAVSAVSIALFAIPSVAQAAGSPSFDNIGISYADIDFGGVSPDGFTINAEKTLQNSFFLSADLLYFSESRGNQSYSSKVDISLFNANINYKLVENDGFVAYAGIGVSHINVDASTSMQGSSYSDSDSETGWNALFGVRQAITSNFELDANIRHMDIADDSDQIINVSARFYPTERVSLNLGYTKIDSNFDYIELGASYHF